MSNVDIIIDRLKEACETLGIPVDLDRSYNEDEDNLPRISIYSGNEITVDEGPADAWAEEVDIRPVVEILVQSEDVDELGWLLRSKWNELRSAFRSVDWTEYTVSGSIPSYEKTSLLVTDKAGVSGAAITFNFRVELD